MTAFDAWHLPGLEPAELALASHVLGNLDVRVPALTAEQLDRVLDHIVNARTALLEWRVGEIVAAIDAVAQRLADATSAEGAAARALLPAATGYSAETVADILQHMTYDWSAGSLNELLEAELASPEVLDRHVPDGHARFVLARGPRLSFQLFSGNVPGVAVTALIRCLLVKSATLGKTASGEPVLPVLFARLLAAVAPPLANCVAVTYWPGGTEVLEERALARADAVVVYGGADAVQSVSRRTAANARLIVHGPKLSIGLIGRAASLAVAPAIAAAVAAYDQQGCVSPHVIYVERGGIVTAKHLAQAIAEALERLAVTQPRRVLDTAETLAIRTARESAEFRAINGADTHVFASNDTSYTVIYDADRTLTVSCLNRTVYVKPIDDAQDIVPLIAPGSGIMQSVALAGFSANQASMIALTLAKCGVTRVTTFRHLPWPRMWWHHDGNGPLRELLTWHDLEV